jgi:hypothetical protein
MVAICHRPALWRTMRGMDNAAGISAWAFDNVFVGPGKTGTPMPISCSVIGRWELTDGTTMPADVPERLVVGEEFRVTVPVTGCRRLVLLEGDRMVMWVDAEHFNVGAFNAGESFPICITFS